MDRITVEKFAFDQQRIRYWGVPCGYCGDKPGMPVCFLAGQLNTLSVKEKADVIEYVMRHVGAVKRTIQTTEAFDEIERRKRLADRGDSQAG